MQRVEDYQDGSMDSEAGRLVMKPLGKKENGMWSVNNVSTILVANLSGETPGPRTGQKWSDAEYVSELFHDALRIVDRYRTSGSILPSDSFSSSEYRLTFG